MEYLDIVDEYGIPTGAVISRQEAHRKGIRHRTSHVWIVRENNHVIQILLQKRSDNKDSYPGCYDISSAGHIPAGVEFKPSAIRELQEELGISASEQELIFCGQRAFHFQKEFHGNPFYDNQISNVYLLWLDREPKQFVLQEEEVSEVRWFEFEECYQKIANHDILNCIFLEELDMVREGIRKSRYKSESDANSRE